MNRVPLWVIICLGHVIQWCVVGALMLFNIYLFNHTLPFDISFLQSVSYQFYQHQYSSNNILNPFWMFFIFFFFFQVSLISFCCKLRYIFVIIITIQINLQYFRREYKRLFNNSKSLENAIRSSGRSRMLKFFYIPHKIWLNFFTQKRW